MISVILKLSKKGKLLLFFLVMDDAISTDFKFSFFSFFLKAEYTQKLLLNLWIYNFILFPYSKVPSFGMHTNIQNYNKKYIFKYLFPSKTWE